MELLRNIFKKFLFKCLIGIIGTSLANIAKVTLEKGNREEEIRQKRFLYTCVGQSYFNRTLRTKKDGHLSSPDD